MVVGSHHHHHHFTTTTSDTGNRCRLARRGRQFIGRWYHHFFHHLFLHHHHCFTTISDTTTGKRWEVNVVLGQGNRKIRKKQAANTYQQRPAGRGRKDYPIPASWKRIFFMTERRTMPYLVCISKFVSSEMVGEVILISCLEYNK